jgi:type IV pilus assembly protein PilE
MNRQAIPAQRGFTLIELMAVIVIIAILTMIALPSYRESVMRARRAEAKELILSIAQAQERYYSANAKYAAQLSDMGITKATSDHGYYNADASMTGGTGYTITVSPAGDQAADQCGKYTLTEIGVRGNSGSGVSVEQCW